VTGTGSLPTPGIWGPLDFADPLCEHIGGLQMMELNDPGEPVRFGFKVKPHHCNRLKSCHGGFLSTFLDIALGVSAFRAIGYDRGGPTIELALSFLQGAHEGQWLESRVTLEHATRSLVFARGTVVGPGGNIARGSALFKLPRQ
jgi:acyl-coenzyme A thioesterase PaaI-like protein